MATILLGAMKSDYMRYWKRLRAGSGRKVQSMMTSIHKKVSMYNRRMGRDVARLKQRGLFIRRLFPCIRAYGTETDLKLFLKMFHAHLKKRDDGKKGIDVTDTVGIPYGT